MSSSLQSNSSYSDFGFEPEQQEDSEQISSQPDNSYSNFGFEPEREKTGKLGSAWYGLLEGVLAAPALAEFGANKGNEAFKKAYKNHFSPETEEEKLSNPKKNHLLNVISKFPESENETGRRIRASAAALPLSALAGIPGIVAGLVGSQAGQSVRELFGKEGKFEEFGLGEGAAIGADILSGGVAGLATSLGRNAVRSGARAASSQVPVIFQEGQGRLANAQIKNVIQGEKNALNNMIDSFARLQIQGFEQQAAAISPNRYSELLAANVSGLQRNADNMFRANNLSIISPLEVTTEQGGRAIQESANALFQDTVINAERQAYGAAREAASNLTGTASETVEAATRLRDSLVSTTPSGEQNPLVNYLNGLILDLQTSTPASTRPASTLLDQFGNPARAAQEVPASTAPTVRTANELVDLVQKTNQAINYGSEFREQSHRLIPIADSLRRETAVVLSQDPRAANLFHQANTLHANNAETWGTRYMRNVRFTENPESIVSSTGKASNMRNLKQAIPDPTIQGLAERMVIDKMTSSGSTSSNRTALNNLAPELSLNARNAGENLINVKDPLTTTGGRAQVRNEILKDAAQSVNTGKRPEKILQLMETPKGYMLVREALSGSPQGREIFQAAERLFVEDIFTSITDKNGVIDFAKARNIFKNQDVRQVAEMIGGVNLAERFSQLEGFANALERNFQTWSNPETQSVLKQIFNKAKNAGIAGAVLHALHVPWPVIASIGIGNAVLGTAKIGYNALQKVILSNPEAIRILGLISRANTTEELAKQVPRFLAQIGEASDEK